MPMYNTPNYYQGYPQTGGQAPYQMQQQMQQPQVRMVSSREEALAVPADFWGTPIYMHDVAHGRVYRKCWNAATGAADFDEFGMIPKTTEPAQAPAASYATVDQVKALESKLAEIESYIHNNA